MHRISKSTIQAARRHAKEILEHGKTIERFGLLLQQTSDEASSDCGQFIKECGKCVQQQAQKIRLYVQVVDQVEDAYSTQVYGRAVDSHVDATAMHIISVRMYTLRMNELLANARQQNIY